MKSVVKQSAESAFYSVLLLNKILKLQGCDPLLLFCNLISPIWLITYNG